MGESLELPQHHSFLERCQQTILIRPLVEKPTKVCCRRAGDKTESVTDGGQRWIHSFIHSFVRNEKPPSLSPVVSWLAEGARDEKRGAADRSEDGGRRILFHPLRHSPVTSASSNSFVSFPSRTFESTYFRSPIQIRLL